MIFRFVASPINMGAITMLAGLVIVPLVSLITPKLGDDKVEGIFACYNEKVSIEKKYSLEENEGEN
jgi:SSS family solute:Na+ symporter